MVDIPYLILNQYKDNERQHPLKLLTFSLRGLFVIFAQNHNKKINMKESNIGNAPLYIGLSVFFIFTVLGLTYMIQNSNSYDERGTFGDMFGFANALFTGFSFIGLIGTILLQRHDINTQRKELQKQTKSIHVQNFESTFFQMLTIFQGIVDNLEIVEYGESIKGRRVFGVLNQKIKNELFEITMTEEYQERSSFEIEDVIRYVFIEKDDAIEAYDKVYSEYGDVLGHYFRSLYHIVKFTDKYKGIDKQKYISIARSHLSNSEQVLLYYNCLHENGVIKFMPLVKKYALLKNIDWDYFPDQTFMLFYDIDAYVNVTSN
ncbi:putative phage abortive infection protein [Chryseobacterium sp. PMSZPI]|uniref:putative phage abortive infection protein n=1 Tax=Chryseobacterium sp. PMSZPI TaxID=1033900 RepID=UPI0039A17CF3